MSVMCWFRRWRPHHSSRNEGKEVVLKNGDHPMNREKYTPDSGLAPLNANADSVLALISGSLRFAGMTTFSNGEL